jgi:phage shock protein A
MFFVYDCIFTILFFKRRQRLRRQESLKARMSAERAGRPFDEDDAFTSESSQSSWEEFDSEADEWDEREELRSEVTAVRGVLAGMQTTLAQLATDMAELKARQIG